MTEVLFEVMPTEKVKEKTIQKYYSSEKERELLELSGFIPIDRNSSSGISIKVVREILI